MQDAEKDGMKLSPFSFWTGFWSGMGTVMSLFYSAPNFAPRHYPKDIGVHTDWAVVGRDLDAAVRKFPKQKRAVNG
jgi:hypothetical protein